MRALPGGTVTLLFTDIEGSTRLLHELGERYADVLLEHRRLLREAFERHGGVEVDTQGDAFFVAFARASDAVAAAREGQTALEGGRVRVRIGIHTGEPVLTDEGYVGADVHRAARIMGAGHGGQILLSETTRQLLDAEAEFRDLGDHRLKDLTAPQRLFQAGDGDFPPLKTLYRTNLPIQPNPLVGRERELEEAGALLREHRLITLTGPGGSGKTRLALQLAAEAVEQFPDGVFWVPLQALRDPALVERAIGASVGADDGLVEYLANKRLLVLARQLRAGRRGRTDDLGPPRRNAEHRCPRHEPGAIARRFGAPVPGRAVPDDDAAVLFVERAQAVAPGFRPQEPLVRSAGGSTGFPLAIELAAARVALLDPDELLARLDRRLSLLASRSRDAPARQRTLRATIEWSYELLEPEEQELFRKLAVFRGSFSLEAPEAVCDADLDDLESLVVKNLVRRWGSGRLGMLDTIREFAAEVLDAAPDADDVHRRHAQYFLSVAREANIDAAALRPGGQRLDLAFAEQDNSRGALAWAMRSGSIPLGMEIATALEQLWVTLDPSEGVRWFARLFEHPDADRVSAGLRAQALRAYGSSLHVGGRLDIAEERWLESLALFEELDDEHGRAVLLHRLGISSMLLRGDLERARELVETSDEIHRRTGNVWGRAQTTGTLGAIARDEGNESNARSLVRESVALAREAQVPWWESGALAELACLDLNAGRLDEGEAHVRESLAIAVRLHDRPGRIFGVGILARVAAERGQSERAGRLWSAIEDEQAAAPLGGWRRHRDACEARIRRASGPDFERGYAEGRELTLDDAASLALSESG